MTTLSDNKVLNILVLWYMGLFESSYAAHYISNICIYYQLIITKSEQMFSRRIELKSNFL